jgi:hypothetical protein
MFVPEARSPDDKVAFGIWADDQLVGILDLLLRYLDEETVDLGLLLVDRVHQARGSAPPPARPWTASGFWRRMGFAEDGEVAPTVTTSPSPR